MKVTRGGPAGCSSSSPVHVARDWEVLASATKLCLGCFSQPECKLFTSWMCDVSLLICFGGIGVFNPGKVFLKFTKLKWKQVCQSVPLRFSLIKNQIVLSYLCCFVFDRRLMWLWGSFSNKLNLKLWIICSCFFIRSSVWTVKWKGAKRGSELCTVTLKRRKCRILSSGARYALASCEYHFYFI